MRQRQEILTYKLPPQFLDAFRAEIEAIDWTASQRITLALGWEVEPVLEAVAGRTGKIIRPGTPKSANLIRRFVNAQTQEPPQP